MRARKTSLDGADVVDTLFTYSKVSQCTQVLHEQNRTLEMLQNGADN